MKQLFFYIVALLFIPCLNSFGQVSVTRDESPPDASAMLDVQATDAGMLIPRMTQAQRMTIADPANGLMVYQANGISGFYYFDGIGWTRIGGHSGHYIGESFGGGVIFWLDETGKHGLIVSMVDLSATQAWSNVANVLIGPVAQSVWNGPGNSLAIVNQAQHTSSAAKLCLDYVNIDYGTGIFTDWYLPSTGEARHLANNITQVQKNLETDGNPSTIVISDGFYWTSSETDPQHAWANSLCTTSLPGSWVGTTFKSELLFVRAVRAF